MSSTAQTQTNFDIAPGKTLYLDGRRKLNVWREGPSLCVQAKESALRRVPFCRIRRIVVSGQVEWRTPALLACAQEGIGIVFLNRRGNIQAQVHGAMVAVYSFGLPDVLDSVLGMPGGVARIKLWLSACEQQTRRLLHANLVHRIRSIRPPAPSPIRGHISRRCLLHVRGNDLKRFDSRLQALLASHVSMLLEQSGIDACMPALLAADLDIYVGFNKILIWQIQPAKISILKKLAMRAKRNGIAFPAIQLGTVARFYESQSEEIEKQCRGLISRLHAFLIELEQTHAE